MGLAVGVMVEEGMTVGVWVDVGVTVTVDVAVDVEMFPALVPPTTQMTVARDAMTMAAAVPIRQSNRRLAVSIQGSSPAR